MKSSYLFNSTLFQESIKKIIKHFLSYNECAETNFQEIFKYETFKAELAKIEGLRDAKKSQTKELEAQCKEAQIDWQKQNQEYEPLKIETRDLLQKAKSSTGGFKCNEPGFQKFQKAFDKFPGSLHEINEKIRIETGKIYCMTSVSGENNVRNELFQIPYNLLWYISLF